MTNISNNIRNTDPTHDDPSTWKDLTTDSLHDDVHNMTTCQISKALQTGDYTDIPERLIEPLDDLRAQSLRITRELFVCVHRDVIDYEQLLSLRTEISDRGTDWTFTYVYGRTNTKGYYPDIMFTPPPEMRKEPVTLVGDPEFIEFSKMVDDVQEDMYNSISDGTFEIKQCKALIANLTKELTAQVDRLSQLSDAIGVE